MYNFLFTRRALKDLEKLDEATQQRLLEKIRDYAQEPLKYARKLTSPKIGTYRFRIGDYRVIFDIEDDNIVILRLGHRKKIYE